MWNNSGFKKLITLAFLLMPGILRAENPTPAEIPLILDFSQVKGFANYSHSEGIRDDEAQGSDNIEYYKTRDLSVRKSVNDITTQDPVTGAFPRSTANWLKYFKSTTSPTAYLFTKVANNLLFWNTTNNGVASFGNIFGIPVGQSDALISGEVLYIVCETSGSKYVKILPDGNGNNVSVYFTTAIPSGKYAQFHLDRFIVAGDTIVPNRVYYSWHDNPLNFHPLDFFDIQSAKRDNIVTGVGEPFLGMLPVYTRYSTRVMVGNAFPDGGSGGNITERVISDSVGAFHHWTVKNRKDGQYFLSEGVSGLQPGIYRFNGVNVQEVTISFRQWFIDNVKIDSAVVPSAFVYDDKYCLIHTSKTGIMNSRMMCLDERNIPSFYNFNPLYVDYYDVFQSSAFGLSNAVGSSKFGIVGFGGATAFDTVLGVRQSINFKYQTKDFDFGQQNRGKKKSITRAYIDFQQGPGNFQVQAIYDFGQATTSWIVDMQTQYTGLSTTSAIRTVNYSSAVVINKLVFPLPTPATPRENKFNFVNFLITSTCPVHINSMDIYATAEQLQ